MKRLAVAACAGAVIGAVLPAAAQAHGLIQRANLPIPEWLFGGAAAIVLVVSFAALALLWPQPRIEGSNGWRPLPGLGRLLASSAVEYACQAIGVLLLALVLVAGFAGKQTADENFA